MAVRTGLALPAPAPAGEARRKRWLYGPATALIDREVWQRESEPRHPTSLVHHIRPPRHSSRAAGRPDPYRR